MDTTTQMLKDLDKCRNEVRDLSDENTELIEGLETIKDNLKALHYVTMLEITKQQKMHIPRAEMGAFTVLASIAVDTLHTIGMLLADSEGEELPF